MTALDGAMQRLRSGRGSGETALGPVEGQHSDQWTVNGMPKCERDWALSGFRYVECSGFHYNGFDC